MGDAKLLHASSQLMTTSNKASQLSRLTDQMQLLWRQKPLDSGVLDKAHTEKLQNTGP